MVCGRVADAADAAEPEPAQSEPTESVEGRESREKQSGRLEKKRTMYLFIGLCMFACYNFFYFCIYTVNHIKMPKFIKSLIWQSSYQRTRFRKVAISLLDELAKEGGGGMEKRRLEMSGFELDCCKSSNKTRNLSYRRRIIL
jgi:hypothetical protein